MSMREYRCRECGQIFQIVEIPDEAHPAPLECPACQSKDLEPRLKLDGNGVPPRR